MGKHTLPDGPARVKPEPPPHPIIREHCLAQ
jgi:hypothetical protein